MERGERDGLAVKAQLVKFIELVGDVAYLIRLVDGKNDGLSAFFEHHGDVAVVCKQSRTNIAHKDDGVRHLNGDLCLVAHLRENDIVGLGLDAARVDDGEAAPSPLAIAVNAVARDTGGVLYDTSALADQFIKQCTFADVGASNDGNHRLCHINFLLS